VFDTTATPANWVIPAGAVLASLTIQNKANAGSGGSRVDFKTTGMSVARALVGNSLSKNFDGQNFDLSDVLVTAVGAAEFEVSAIYEL